MKAYEFIKAYDSNNNNNVTEAVKLLQLDDWCVLALEAHPSIRYFEAPSSWPAHDTKNTADFLNDVGILFYFLKQTFIVEFGCGMG